jgi:hypothetical protein
MGEGGRRGGCFEEGRQMMRLVEIVLPVLVGALAMLAWSSAVSAAPQEEEGQGNRPSYPSSVESDIERRRNRMDRRREQYLDWRTGRRWYLPPWTNAQHDWMNAREETMREKMRRRRDAMDTRQDAIGRWSHPWSQWQQDWSEAQRNARDLARLRREEYFERFRYGPALGGWGLPY